MVWHARTVSSEHRRPESGIREWQTGLDRVEQGMPSKSAKWTARNGQRTDEQTSPPVTEVSIVIGGMTCGSCAAGIERRLNGMDGVTASVNLASERARVVHSNAVPVERLIEEIEAAGYTAHLVDRLADEPEVSPEADLRVRYLGRRLVVAAVLFVPLCDVSIIFSFFPVVRFPGWQWPLIVLAAPVVTWAAWPFYSAAIRGVRHLRSTMDTLVSLGIIAATGWSVYAMFWQDTDRGPQSVLSVLTHQAGGGIYIDVAAGVTTFLLAGRYFEAWSRRRTGNALRSLASVGAKEVAILDSAGIERRLPIGELQVGNRFVVRPGEIVATDGEVALGHSAIDRSAMTGESIPVDVAPGDRVIGGTIAVGGRLVVRATKVGLDTQLAHMVKLVEDAQNEKAGAQRLADRVASIFVPAVIVISVGTLVAWLLAGGSSEQAVRASLSVLIIACPCALGLATPTALLVASGEGARLGIFFKGYQGIEASHHVDTVVLDKTGTVTEGRMVVVDVVSIPEVDRSTLLRSAGALEQASEHLIAQAVTAAAQHELGALPAVERFRALHGLGARGMVDGHEITVGKAELFDRPSTPIPASVEANCVEFENLGQTAVLVGRDDVIVGAIAIADSIRPSAAAAVRELQALGLRCVLLTGDNERTARVVARSIGVTEVIAGALPADKVSVIRRLQAEGRSVAMVGDGVNDAPALASADLGLAIGSGTDVAINAADLIVVRDDLRVVAMAISLARRTLRTIRGNLIWAFAYNLAAIPVAACGLLNPLIAAAAMALSSSFVVWNSARLRHFSNSKAMRRLEQDAHETASQENELPTAPDLTRLDDRRPLARTHQTGA